VPAIVAWFAVKWLNKVTPIPLRETPNAPLHSVRATMARPESELPSLFASILPVVLPIFLISAASVCKVIQESNGWTSLNNPQFIQIKQWVDFIGNKNIALIVGAVLSLWLLKRQQGLRWREINDLAGAPLETGGVIILITAAGGAFGYMLTQSGVGGTVEALAKASGMNLLLAAYFVALVIRVAQGSATVAMQTASAMFAALVPSLDCHPIYLFLTIGFGAIGCSWMNDSGFWVVSRLSGFTERETLRTWTVLLTVISVSGFLFAWVLSRLLPFHG
jgi:GntP family gluconate:H+ symporter